MTALTDEVSGKHHAPGPYEPIYRKVERPGGACSIICDQGPDAPLVLICEGVPGHIADWIIGKLGREPMPFPEI